MKKFIVLTMCFFILFSFSACKKKEAQPPAPQTQEPLVTGPIMPPGQMPPGQMPPGQQMAKPGVMMPKGQTKVVVPEKVKAQWVGAKIIFEDKVSKTKQEYTVKLNSDFKIPNTNLRIHIGDFLPDFKMDGLSLTSGSNEPKNPALGIRVLENDKQIFPGPGRQWGWLFSKVPSIHPFEHPKYGVTLKEGVKKG